MARLLAAFIGMAVLLLAGSNVGVDASNPGTAQPLLGCADVNADGPVTGADISKIVQKFGAVYGQPSYHPLYDLTASDSIVGADISTAVADFGLVCSSASPVDTEIAIATLAMTDPTFGHVLCDPNGEEEVNCGGDTRFLTENVSFLASREYVSAGPDVPGQGRHYFNLALFEDDLFNPARPEGMVYDNGRLYAQLYYIDGDEIGWGSEPPPEDQVNIDAFCQPQPCSWAGTEDGWHLHVDLCMLGLGTPNPTLYRSPKSGCPHENDGGCPPEVPDCNQWHARVGWMGHLWNHDRANPNGRFADCYPDPPWNWKAFNCPQ